MIMSICFLLIFALLLISFVLVFNLKYENISKSRYHRLIVLALLAIFILLMALFLLTIGG